jgi:cystathionine beta-synthase
MASKDGSIPDLVLVTPDETARAAWALMRSLGVSQVVVSVSKEPPLAAKEVSGTLDELSLMDLAFRDPTVLEHPVSEVMSPAMPMIGIGEPIPAVVDRLNRSPAVLVLDGGHPVGVLSRSDLLSFLASKAAG